MAIKTNILGKYTFPKEPDGVALVYFSLRLFDRTELIVWNILRSTQLGCKDMGIRKFYFVAKKTVLNVFVSV